MFEIKETVGQYRVFTLFDKTEKSHFTINPERGGIVTEFQVEGIGDILYMNEEIYKDPSKYIRGGMPVLFPVAGRLSEDSYRFQDTEYFMPVHGLARNYPWEVRAVSLTEGAEIVVGLRSNEETLQAFPFSFDMEYTYTLKGNTLAVKQNIHNLSAQIMPLSFGFHPYFKVMDKQKAKVLLKSDRYKDMVSGNVVLASESPDFTKEPELGCLFLNVADKRAVLLADRCRIEITFEQNYRHILLWSLAGEDFICVEPWTAKPDALNTKEDLLYVKPGESVQSFMNITVTKEAE